MWPFHIRVSARWLPSKVVAGVKGMLAAERNVKFPLFSYKFVECFDALCDEVSHICHFSVV